MISGTKRFRIRPNRATGMLPPIHAVSGAGTRTGRETARAVAGIEAVDSVVVVEIHAGVEAGHLLAVAVEHQGRATAFLANALFGGLAPAGMGMVGIHVRVEPILVRGIPVPTGGRLLRHERNLHDRLDTLEAVLTGNDE